MSEEGKEQREERREKREERREKRKEKNPIKNNKMTQRISKYQRFKMMNPVLQFFKFIYLSIKIMIVVAGGHGGTKEKKQLPVMFL